MKILVIGDTHNNISMACDIWSKLVSIDMVIHTGDYCSDAVALEKEFGVPFVYVKGNCDGSLSSTECSTRGGDFAVVETDAGKILVTHGHNEHVNYDLDRLHYKALENGCIAAVFGHTHRAVVLEEDIWYVNPGSLPRPRDGSGGSYAIIRTSRDSFEATVVYYNTVMNPGGPGSSGSHRSSGYISSLLKYSDRL